jgi:hypothetical protein
MDQMFADSNINIPRLCGLGCCVHNMHIVQGRCFCIMNSTISGCISLALAEQPAGAVVLFRRAIEKILLLNLKVFLIMFAPFFDVCPAA